MRKAGLIWAVFVFLSVFGLQAQEFQFLNVNEKLISSPEGRKNVDTLYVLDSLVVNVFIFESNFYFVVPYYIMYFNYDENLNILDFKTTVLIGTRYDTIVHTLYWWDAGQRLIEKRILALDSLGGNRKFNYSYDSLSRLVSMLYQKDTDTVWFNYRLDSMFYQNIDSLQSVVSVKKQYVWNDSLDAWVPGAKFQYKFDTSTGLPVSTTIFYWVSDGWSPVHLDSIIYGDDSLKLKEQFFTWKNSFWSLDSEYVYFYDDEKNLIRHQLFAVQDTDTVLVRQIIYGYDSSNNLQVDTLMVHDSTAGGLQYVKNSFYLYDSRGNLRLMKIQNWDVAHSQWVNFQKHEINCDTNVAAEKVILPEDLDLGLYLNNKLNYVFVYKWDSEHDMWIYFYKYELFYTQYLTSINSLTGFSIYPNPVGRVLHIATQELLGANIKIYNMQGQIVKSLKLIQPSINVSQLSPGIYILVAEKGGKRLSVKFIKQ